MDQFNYQRPRRPSTTINQRYRRPQQFIQATSSIGAHAFLPPFIAAARTSFSNRQWRPRPPTVPSYRQHPYNQQQQRLPSFGPPPLMRSTTFRMRTFSSNVRSQTPRLSGPGINRIFVDGKSYEVFYLDNEAVIEQNGLPHRVFFVGPSRDILIDGKAHTLAFGETKLIQIDGISYFIKFGSPFRELFISDNPFRASFDYTPVYAVLNGTRHEFRLSGPPPKVQIDPNPCYELVSQLNSIRDRRPQKQQENNVIGKSEEDVDTWLQRIKKLGVDQIRPFRPTSGFKTYPRPTKTFPQKRFQQQRSFIDYNITREIKPPPSMKDYEIDTFMVRYSVVVAALLRPRPTCPHCAIEFTDTTSDAYQRHIDKHVQENIKTKNSNISRSRKWFMEVYTWLTFDEFAEVQKPPTTELQATSSSPSATDAIAAPSLNNACFVCHEKFNEYYDNDEEEWRFQECIVKGKIAIHKYCVEQMKEEEIINDENVGIKQEMAR